MSRRPHEKHPTDDASLKEQNRILNFTEQLTKNSSGHELSDDVVRAICESRLIQWPECPNDFPAAFVSSLPMQETAVPDAYGQEDQCGGLPTIPTHSRPGAYMLALLTFRPRATRMAPFRVDVRRFRLWLGLGMG